MSGHIHKFAGEFEGGTKSQWRTLAETALRGAEFETLVRRSEDGIWLGPLFTKDDAQSETALTKGSAPHLTGRPWHIDALIDHPDITNANKDILADLKGGASALTLKIDPSGKTGIALRDKLDLQRLLAGVHTDLVPIKLLPAAENFKPAALMAAHFKNHIDLAHIYLSLGYAPLHDGGDKVLDVAGWVKANAPHWKAISIDASAAYEAGATPAQELAYMLSRATSYVRRLESCGFTIDDIFSTIDVHLSSGQDVHQGIVKFRAARLLWAQLTGAFGASNTNCTLHATSARRMLAKTDPWSNLLRLNSACFGAVCGGVDYITVLPHTHPLGLATPFARRIARNMQLLQMEETQLGHVSDPASGSYMHETLTYELAKKAWEIFQHMESLGDWPNSENWLVAQIKTANDIRLQKIKDGDILLIGVNQFAKPDVRRAEILSRPVIKPKSGKMIQSDNFKEAILEASNGYLLPSEALFCPLTPVRLSEAHEREASS